LLDRLIPKGSDEISRKPYDLRIGALLWRKEKKSLSSVQNSVFTPVPCVQRRLDPTCPYGSTRWLRDQLDRRESTPSLIGGRTLRVRTNDPDPGSSM
jgi:hypothetical protein